MRKIGSDFIKENDQTLSSFCKDASTITPNGVRLEDLPL